MRISKINKPQQAIWNDTVIALSNETLSADGYIYFPPDSVNKEYLVRSDHHTYCPWKGKASYYDVVVNGKINHDAAWYYPDTLPKAEELKNWIGFWKGIEIKSLQ